jgi:hypothetical protein
MCYNCANACLDEKDIESLRNCIRLTIECAAICQSADGILLMDRNSLDIYCRLCAEICLDCAEECWRHAALGMEHCRICAEACCKCAEACLQMIAPR